MDLDRKVGLFTGLAVGATYLLRVGPSLGWQDSGELVSAAFQLGVPHPTGFPPVMLGAKLMTLLPFAEVALRAGLLSVLTSAVAVGFIAALTTRLAAELDVVVWVRALAGGLAALTLGLAPSMVQNSTTLEAYGPSLALLMAMIALATGGREQPTGRQVCLIALCLGLGATMHVTIRVHGIIPLLAALWWCRGGRRRVLLLAIIAASLGLLATAYVPLASLRDAPLDWGDPETFGRLWDHLTGGRIRRAFDGRMLNPYWVPHDAPVLGRLLVGDLGIPTCLLAAVGFVGLLRQRVRAAALLALIASVDAAYCIVINPMGLVDRQVGLPLMSAIVIFAGLGLTTIAKLAGRAAPVGAVGVTLIVGFSYITRGNELVGPGYGPASMVTSALALPPRSVVLCSSDNLCGGALWAQYVEGARPDVLVLPRQHLWDEATLRSRLSRHAPELANEAEGGLELVEAVSLLREPRFLFWERGGEEGELRRGRRGARLTLDAPIPLLRLDGDSTTPVAAARIEYESAISRWYGRAQPPDEFGRRVVSGMLSSLAITAVEQDSPDVARELLRRSLGVHPSASSLLNLSALEVREGRMGPALHWIEQALEVEPGNTRALIAAGKLHLAEGRDEEARRAFVHARRLCPTRCGGPLEGLGILAAREGEYDTARELLTEALRREPWLRDARDNLRLLDRVAPPS